MKLNFYNLKLKEGLDQLRVIHWGHFSLVSLALLFEFYLGFLGWSVVIEMIALLVLYRLYFRSVKELYYSFWTFSLFLFIYIGWGFYNAYFNFDHIFLSYLYFFAIVLMLLEVYILSSPIYFPMVSWWEYDFRYRYDFKVKLETVSSDEKIFEARVTDMRRNASCVVSFEDFEIGSILIIKPELLSYEVPFRIEVVSKREPLSGRGIMYGTKYLFDDEHDKRYFDDLRYLWRVEKYFKKQKKFA